MRKLFWVGVSILALLLAGCGDEDPNSSDPAPELIPEKITILAHDSFVGGVEADTFAEFVTQTGVEVEMLPAGDAGGMVNQAILTRSAPLADLMFGIDNTLLSRGLEADLFVPYRSPQLWEIPTEFNLNTAGLVTPISYGDVCINYDIAALAESGLPTPQSLDDLLEPEFGGTLVVENPATSSPGLAFLLATFGTYGENGWEDFWKGLVSNDVEVEPSWDSAYYGSFSRYGGDRPLVVSYASSPPAEVIFSDPVPTTAPTGVLTDGCYRQIEYGGILAGTPYPQMAGQLLDFMLSVEFQDQIPLSWFVFPVQPDATLPPEFVEHTILPSQPIVLDPELVDRNRADLIETWTEIVLP